MGSLFFGDIIVQIIHFNRLDSTPPLCYWTLSGQFVTASPTRMVYAYHRMVPKRRYSLQRNLDLNLLLTIYNINIYLRKQLVKLCIVILKIGVKNQLISALFFSIFPLVVLMYSSTFSR